MLCDPCVDVAAKDVDRLAECGTDGRDDSVAVAFGFAALWAVGLDSTARHVELGRYIVVFFGCRKAERHFDAQRRSIVLVGLS